MVIRLDVEQVGSDEGREPLEVLVDREKGKIKIEGEVIALEGYSRIDVEYREGRPAIKVVYGISDGNYQEEYQKKVEARENDIRGFRDIKCIKFKRKRFPVYDFISIRKNAEENETGGEIFKETDSCDGKVPFLEIVFEKDSVVKIV